MRDSRAGSIVYSIQVEFAMSGVKLWSHVDCFILCTALHQSSVTFAPQSTSFYTLAHNVHRPDSSSLQLKPTTRADRRRLT
jgi:hypothetical protein